MRSVVVCAVLTGLLPIASSQEGSPANPLVAVYACASLTDSEQRLACFDEAVGRLKSAEDAREVKVISKAEAEQVRQESFGFNLPSLPTLFSGGEDSDETKIERVTLAVTKVETDLEGRLRVTLENGAVWQQIDSNRVKIFRNDTVKEATISAASLGSFLLRLDDRRAFRARRVQ